uniref:C-type lectin domain family 12 member B-like n=1 Tax=Oryzias melastigma TaxID=30732 RepID=A0A3B3DU97_ORYME
MEEELHYASVIFRNKNPPQKGEYLLNIKAKQRLFVFHINRNPAVYFILMKCFFYCFLFFTVILRMNKSQADLMDLSALNDQLLLQIKLLRNQTEELSSERDELNRTLGVIMRFESFPVEGFCPEKKCQPCQRGWIHFQQKCYMFYQEDYGWKNWADSRKFCQKVGSDLVVVDNLQEQEFIRKNCKFYFDEYHGYWLGLHKNGNSWQWIDGRNDTDTLGSWAPGFQDPSLRHALMIPDDGGRWRPARAQFLNRFICEGEVLIKSS